MDEHTGKDKDRIIVSETDIIVQKYRDHLFQHVSQAVIG